MDAASCFNFACHRHHHRCIALQLLCRHGNVLTAICPTQEILLPTPALPTTAPVRGHDFNTGANFDDIMASMLTSGFQAQELGQAFAQINDMVSCCT